VVGASRLLDEPFTILTTAVLFLGLDRHFQAPRVSVAPMLVMLDRREPRVITVIWVRRVPEEPRETRVCLEKMARMAVMV
jgi:hypothetical protein